MNNDRNFNVYNILFNDINSLKDRVQKLEKENFSNIMSVTQITDESKSIPQTIVTDISFDNNSLKVVQYDRKTDTTTTKYINLSELSEDEQSDNQQADKVVKRTGSYLTVENMADELSKILTSNN